MAVRYPPADDVVIRAASERDVPAMAEIERRAFSDAWPASAFRSLLRSATARVRVAESEGEIIGYSVVMVVLDEAELANIAVAESARGRGVGRRLMTALLLEARQSGVRSMFLEVRESNVDARALYESCGFMPMGRRRAYYRDPDEDALQLVWRENPAGIP